MSLAGAQWSDATLSFDRGCTGGGGHDFLISSKMKGELFIMLAAEKGSQGSDCIYFNNAASRSFVPHYFS